MGVDAGRRGEQLLNVASQEWFCDGDGGGGRVMIRMREVFSGS